MNTIHLGFQTSTLRGSMLQGKPLQKGRIPLAYIFCLYAYNPQLP